MSNIEDRLARDIAAVTGGALVTESDLLDARNAVEDRIESQRQRNRRRTVAVVVAAAAAAAVVIPVLAVTALDDDGQPSPAEPVTPTPSSEAEQIIAEGTLESFAATQSGTVLTVWGTCQDFGETDCGYAWRLSTGSQTQATGMVGRGEARVDAFAASGGGFVLTGAGQYGPDRGFLIAEDGTASPISTDCPDASWPTGTEPGRRVWAAGLNFIDTVTGAVCDTGRLGGPPLANGVFTADGTLWALVDNESDPDTLTIGRYDGVGWLYRDLAAKGGSWTSVLAAAGSNVVVLQADSRLIGLSVTTDAGATWSEVVDPDVLEKDLPFSAFAPPNSEDWFSGYTSMAFAGSSALYVADGSGDLWRSTDFTTFSRVSVPGAVSDLQSAGDAVIARVDDGKACSYPPVCQLNDLVRISADGSVEPITAR